MFSPENKRYLHLLLESRRNYTLSCLVISQRWCTWIRGQWHGSPDKPLPPSSNKRHVRHLVGDTFSEFRLTSTTPRVLRGIRAFPPKVQSEMDPQSATTALVRVRSCAGGSIRNSDKDDVIFASPWLIVAGLARSTEALPDGLVSREYTTMSDGAARPCTGQQTGPTRYELGSSVSERRQRFVLPPKCAEVNVLKTPETCIASMIGSRTVLEKKKKKLHRPGRSRCRISSRFSWSR